tara:strand:+ start:1262 stop:1669 length:408 start_codon:yes stop_codon:yes gene_type:complete
MAKQNRELNKFPKMLNMIVTELLHEKRVDISLISKEMSDEKFDLLKLYYKINTFEELFNKVYNTINSEFRKDIFDKGLELGKNSKRVEIRETYQRYLDDNFEDEEAAYIDIKYYVEKVFLDEHIQNYKKELLYAL